MSTDTGRISVRSIRLAVAHRQQVRTLDVGNAFRNLRDPQATVLLDF